MYYIAGSVGQCQIYEFGGGRLGVMIMTNTGSAHYWKAARAAFKSAGLVIVQDGDEEGLRHLRSCCSGAGESGDELRKGSKAATPTNQTIMTYPRVSPNGKWLAYSSNETGRALLYVTSFPSGAGKWQVSSNSGDMPVWRRDSKELYYLGVSSSDFYVVSISETGSQFNLGQPKLLFRQDNIIATGRVYDASPDGSRFIAPVVMNQAGTPTNLLLSWPAELTKK